MNRGVLEEAIEQLRQDDDADPALAAEIEAAVARLDALEKPRGVRHLFSSGGRRLGSRWRR